MQKEQQFEPLIERREVIIRVDEDVGFYKKADVNSDEVDYLLGKGYVLSLQKPTSYGLQVSLNPERIDEITRIIES